MRQGSLAILLALSLTLSFAHAEENQPSPAGDQQAEPGQPLDEQRQRPTDAAQPVSSLTDAERAQLSHLRQENHRLRMQVQDRPPAQLPQPQPQLLNDQQQWFAVGGGVGVLGFLLGVLTTRGRRRRQWLN